MPNIPTFHLQENANYYEKASYTWSPDSIRCINTVSSHTRTCYLYMQECGCFKTVFPYYTERARLPSYLILYTLSGTGLLTYHQKKYELKTGSCFYIDCMESHRYETPKGQDWEFLWLHFYGVNAATYYNDFSTSHLPVQQIQNPFTIENALRRILSIHQSQNVFAEMLTNNLITNIITELLIQKLTNSNSPSRLPDSIHDTISYIQSHYTNPLTLDEIAEQINISKYHLSREFTRYMKTSINQYIINCRINHAKELLRESGLSVGDIAHCVGINYVSYFISVFKDREGVTPLEYRKLWQYSNESSELSATDAFTC